MFTNIGSKIKNLALVLFWIGVIIWLIVGIALISAGNKGYGSNPMILPGILAILVGPLFSWIGSFFTYGFGELIQTNQQLRDALYTKARGYRSTGGTTDGENLVLRELENKRAEYKRMLNSGLITQEEYDAKIGQLS